VAVKAGDFGTAVGVDVADDDAGVAGAGERGGFCNAADEDEEEDNGAALVAAALLLLLNPYGWLPDDGVAAVVGVVALPAVVVAGELTAPEAAAAALAAVGVLAVDADGVPGLDDGADVLSLAFGPHRGVV
jgi:hypothetical protein